MVVDIATVNEANDAIATSGFSLLAWSRRFGNRLSSLGQGQVPVALAMVLTFSLTTMMNIRQENRSARLVQLQQEEIRALDRDEALRGYFADFHRSIWEAINTTQSPAAYVRLFLETGNRRYLQGNFKDVAVSARSLRSELLRNARNQTVSASIETELVEDCMTDLVDSIGTFAVGLDVFFSAGSEGDDPRVMMMLERKEELIELINQSEDDLISLRQNLLDDSRRIVNRVSTIGCRSSVNERMMVDWSEKVFQVF